MEREDKSLLEHLKATNPEFQQLWEEHDRYEQQLELFNTLRYLTSEQELEKKRIQKLKLLGKDRMVAIVKEHKARIGGQNDAFSP